MLVWECLDVFIMFFSGRVHLISVTILCICHANQNCKTYYPGLTVQWLIASNFKQYLFSHGKFLCVPFLSILLLFDWLDLSAKLRLGGKFLCEASPGLFWKKFNFESRAQTRELLQIQCAKKLWYMKPYSFFDTVFKNVCIKNIITCQNAYTYLNHNS